MRVRNSPIHRLVRSAGFYFGLKNWLVTLLCLAGAATGAYFLYTDFYSSGVGGTGKPVGIIERKELTVRKKPQASYVWSNVKVHEELFLKDSIQTGSGGATTIRLNNGSLLDLGENSLVVIDDATNLSVGFLQGSVVVRGRDGSKRLTVDQNGATQVEELRVSLIQPESLVRYFTGSKGPKDISFSWQMRGATEAVTVQVSTDKRFPVQATKSVSPVDPRSLRIQIPLEPGSYYWRVIGKSKVLSETRQFKVIQVYALNPIFPDHSKLILPLDAPVQFRWLSPKDGGPQGIDFSQGEHFLEVSSDQTFKRLVVSHPVDPRNGIANIDDIPNGNFNWRIRSRYGTSEFVSSVKIFELSRTKKAVQVSPTPSTSQRLGYPLMVKPDSGAVINLLTAQAPVEASWSEVDGAEKYDVFIYALQNKNTKSKLKPKLVLRVRTEKTHLDLKPLGMGEFYWTIRAVGKNKKTGEPVPWLRFTMNYGDTLVAPKIISPEVQ